MALSKSNSRQRGRHAAGYKQQYMKTYRNKATRVKQSNGTKFFLEWDKTARLTAINKTAERPKA